MQVPTTSKSAQLPQRKTGVVRRGRRLPEQIIAELVEGDSENPQVTMMGPQEIQASFKAVGEWLSSRREMSHAGGMRRVEETIRLLGEYKVLRGKHIQALLWGRPFEGHRAMRKSSAEKLSEATLATMRRYGLVQHIWLRGRGSGGSAYLLADAGYAAYEELLTSFGKIRMGRPRKPAPPRLYSEKAKKFNHELAITDFMMAVQLDIEGLGGSVDWVSERRSWQLPGYGVAQGQLQWDALGLSDVVGLSFDWFLELDNNTMEHTHMVDKVASYIGHYKKQYKAKTGAWRDALVRSGYPDLLIVTTGTETRLENLVERMSSKLHRLALDNELAMSFTTTTRIGQAIENGLGHNPLDVPVWTTMTWAKGAATGVREEDFVIINYPEMLAQVETKMGKLLGEIEASAGAARARLLERLSEMKEVIAKLIARAAEHSELGGTR